MKKNPTPADRAEWVSQYTAGMPLKQIVALSGRSENTVRRALRRAGLKPQAGSPRRGQDPTRAEIDAMCAQIRAERGDVCPPDDPR